MDKKIIKWREIVSLCGKVVSKLKDNHPDILDYRIMGITRGGLIPAVIISNMLNIRKVYSLEIYQVPEMSSIEKVLLIDDISDSGTTLKLTSEMMSGKEVVTASLFLKHKTTFTPNVYGTVVPDDLWVVFPWE